MASIKITLYPLLFLAILTISKAKLGRLKETEMTFYYQDRFGVRNATVIAIPGPIRPVNFTKFGDMFAMDDLITEETEECSTPIARGRGMFVTSALDGSLFHMVISIVFTNGEYKGSTLEIQGSYGQFQPVSEVAVVGGTGKFRLARGYATFETLYFDAPSQFALLRSNITVLHY